VPFLRGFAGVLSIVVVLAMVGCDTGPTLYPASGTIKVNGSPVEGASVTFAPDSGPIGTGTTDASGKFTISTAGKPGAAPGTCKVTVNKTAGPSIAAPTKPLTPEEMKEIQMKMKADNASAKSEIPAKYTLVTSTDLKATVTTDAAKNVFDFDLK